MHSFHKKGMKKLTLYPGIYMNSAKYSPFSQTTSTSNFGKQIFQQTLGIAMGTDCTPVLTELFFLHI